MPVMAAFCVNSVQKAEQFVKDTRKVHKKFAKLLDKAYNFFMEEKDMDGTLDKLDDQYIK